MTAGKLRLLRELRPDRHSTASATGRARVATGSTPTWGTPSLRSTDVRTFYFFARVSERLPGSLTRRNCTTIPAPPTRETWRSAGDATTTCTTSDCSCGVSSAPHHRIEISPYVQYRDIDHPIFQVIAQVSRDYGLDARYENDDAARRDATTGSRWAFSRPGSTCPTGSTRTWPAAHGALTKNQEDRAASARGLCRERSVGDAAPHRCGGSASRPRRSGRAVICFLSNGDQSDRRVYNPRAAARSGFLYAMPKVDGQFYGNASRSFEPPLLLELNSLTVPGFIALDGQSAWQFELGFRGSRDGVAWDVAAYDIELENEILNLNVQPFPGRAVHRADLSKRPAHAALRTRGRGGLSGGPGDGCAWPTHWLAIASCAIQPSRETRFRGRLATTSRRR